MKHRPALGETGRGFRCLFALDVAQQGVSRDPTAAFQRLHQEEHATVGGTVQVSFDLRDVRAEHVVSKREILEHLYGTGSEVEDNAVEIYIHRLRKKLSGQAIEIKTLRGLGYCLRKTA